MAGQQHRILRQVLEIETPEEGVARKISDDMGWIQRRYLLPIIDECCSELASPDRLYRIDKLEVNLGNVSFSNLQEEVSRSLKANLRQALATRLRALDQEAEDRDGHADVSSRLELLAFFAGNGVVPWWADSQRSRLVPESVEFLLEQAPEELASLILELLQQREAATRIVLHCDDALLLRLFGVLASRAYEVRREVELLAAHGPLRAPTSASRSAVWIALLHHASIADIAARPPVGTAPGPAFLGEAAPFWRRVFEYVARDSTAACATLLEVLPAAAVTPSNAELLPVAAALVAAAKQDVRMPREQIRKAEEILLAAPASRGPGASERTPRGGPASERTPRGPVGGRKIYRGGGPCRCRDRAWARVLQARLGIGDRRPSRTIASARRLAFLTSESHLCGCRFGLHRQFGAGDLVAVSAVVLRSAGHAARQEVC